MRRHTEGRDLWEAVGTCVYGIRTEAPSAMPSGSGGPRHDVGEVQSGYATHRKTGYSPLRRGGRPRTGDIASTAAHVERSASRWRLGTDRGDSGLNERPETIP